MPHDNKALSYTQIEYSVADETAQEERRGGALTEFGKLEHFDFLDAVLSQDGGRSADRAQVETTVLLARRRHHLAAVSLGQHHHAAALTLEAFDVRVHAAGRRRAKRAARVALKHTNEQSVAYTRVLKRTSSCDRPMSGETNRSRSLKTCI